MEFPKLVISQFLTHQGDCAQGI
uniref:Uncharacterized protein n=1 Tax=Vitis vinifera TaxID=29760 RepID=F6I1D2_VITVI